MPAPLRTVFACLIVGLLIGGPWYYALHRDRHSRNFRVVQPGVLYRSGQLTLAGLDRVVKEHRIKTIVTLRDGETESDQKEEEWAGRYYINFKRIPPRPWQLPDSPVVPAEQGLQAFREVMDDPANYPVLIHCMAGVHRTGAYCAVYRMDYEGWTNREAMAEMRVMGYDLLDVHPDLRGYLEKYRPQPGRSVPATAARPVSVQLDPMP